MSEPDKECPACGGCGEVETIKGDILPCPTCIAAEIAEERAQLAEAHATIAGMSGRAAQVVEAMKLGGPVDDLLAFKIDKLEDELANLPTGAKAVMDVVDLARQYRDQEDADTPRMFRGKELHDIGVALDEAIALLPDAKERPHG